jgi:GxxExxY protein
MRNLNKKIIYPELSYNINSVLFKVKGMLGRYKNEKQYCDTIEKEFKKENIKYEREKILENPTQNKGFRSRIDFIIDDKIILEVKAKSFVAKDDYFQIRRYLSDLNLKLGILANMRQYNVLPKRIINSDKNF